MAIRKPVSHSPGHSGSPQAGYSNLPADGVQSGPRFAFGSGGKLGAPQIAATSGLSDLTPRNSNKPVTLDQPPGAPPAALDRPRNGCAGGDSLGIDKYNGC
jgi:hypothetical protein